VGYRRVFLETYEPGVTFYLSEALRRLACPLKSGPP